MWKFTSNRYTRWTARVVKTAGVVALVWLLLAWFVLPPILHSVARSALAGIGLPDIEFKVRAVSLFRTELEDLQFAPDQPSSIQAIAIEYSPASLVRGRIESIRLTGAHVQLAWRNGRLDLAALGLKSSPQPAPSSDPSSNLPLNRIELKASTLQLNWEDASVWIPISGVVEQGNGTITFDLRATIQNAPIEVRGSLAPAGNRFQVVVRCAEAEAAALLALVPRHALARFPALASGELKLAASYRQSADDRRATLDLDGRDLRASTEVAGQRISVTDLAFSARAEIDSQFDLSVLRVALKTGELRAGSYTISNAALRIRGQKDDLIAEGSLGGDTFECRRLEVRLPGILAPGGTEPFRAEVDFSAHGRAPAPIVSMLATRGVDLAALGQADISGRVVYEKSVQSWDLQVPELGIDLAPGTLDLSNLLLQGFAGQLQCGGSADPFAINIALQPGSRFTMRNLIGVPQVRWTQTGDDPLVRVRVAESPATLSISMTADGWHVLAPRVDVTTANLDLSLPRGAAASRTRFAGAVALDASAAETTLRTLDNAAISIGGIQFAQQDTHVAATDVTATLDGPLLYRGVAGLSLAASVGIPNGVAVKSPSFSGSTGEITADARIKLPPDGAPSFGGQVSIKAIGFAHPAGEFALKDASLTLPFAVNSPTPKPGPFEIPHLSAGKERFPPLAGTLRFHDGKFDITADATIIEGGVLHVAATADTTQSPPAVSAKATLPEFSLTDKSAMAGVAPVLKGYDVTGTFSGAADLQLRGSVVHGSATLNINNARMENPASNWLIDGINGDLTFDQFDPVRTRPGQRLTARSVQLGQVRMSDAVCTLRMDGPEQFLIEELVVKFAGGRIFTNSVVLDRNKAVLTAQLTGERLHIEQIMPLVLDKARGSGSLYGRLPVELHWPRTTRGKVRTVKWNEPQLVLGEGFLYATPDGGGLKLDEAGKVFDQYIAAQDRRFQKGGDMEHLRNNLVTALTDMDYSALRVDFINEEMFDEDHLMARVFIAGRGVNNGPTLGGFTVNIHSFDEWLRILLGLRNTVSGFGE